MAYPAPSANRARSFQFLLRLTYAGREWRFSDRPADIDNDAGDSVQHIPWLRVERYTETFEALSDTIDRQSVPIEVLFPFDVAAAVADGYRLDTAEGELSVWVDGTSYDRRRVLLVGRVMEPQYGADGESVRFSLEAPPWLDSATWPDLYRFRAEDTPASINDSQGNTYTLTQDARHAGRNAPTVIGNPGNMRRETRIPDAILGTKAANADLIDGCIPGALTTLTTVGRTTGTPALIVLCEHPTQAGAYGAIDADITSGETSAVTLFSPSGQWVNTTVPYHHTIGGRVCTVVNFIELVVGRTLGSTVAALDPFVGSFDQLADGCGFTFISCHNSFDTFYGLHSGRQTGPLRSIHDLMALVLSESAYPVDWARLYAALDRVPLFNVEGYLDERIKVWDFISRELLPLLPISLRNGPRGLYAITADLSATVDQAIGQIRIPYDGDRVSGVQYERRLADLSGSIEIECGDWSGSPGDVVRVDASSTSLGRRASLARESSVASRALSRVTRDERAVVPSVETIKAPWLAARPRVGAAASSRPSSNVGAHYVAHQRLALRSSQIRTVEYDLAPEFVELEVGDLLHLIDPAVSIDGPAYLTTLSISDGRVRGRFSLYDPVLR